MIDYVKSFEFASTIALFVYWIPAAICLAVYFVTAINLYREDVKKRDEGGFYSPKLTIGWIVWRIVVAITPAANLIALVFDCMADMFKWFGDFLDIPLVPKRKQPKEQA